jgi:hypothetical protein
LLEERLYELDMKSPETGKRLSAGQKGMGETCEVEEYDLVREQLEQAYFRYRSSIASLSPVDTSLTRYTGINSHPQQTDS